MECYNKVIFFYKLQLKWFVLFFYGYLMMYNRRCTSIATAVCNQVCVIISVRFLLFMLAILCSHIVLLLLAHGTIMFFSWNIPKQLFSMRILTLSVSFGVFFVFQTERRPEDLGNKHLFNGRERIGQGKSIHQPSSVDWCILIINTKGGLKQQVYKCGRECIANAL